MDTCWSVPNKYIGSTENSSLQLSQYLENKCMNRNISFYILIFRYSSHVLTVVYLYSITILLFSPAFLIEPLSWVFTDQPALCRTTCVCQWEHFLSFFCGRKRKAERAPLKHRATSKQHHYVFDKEKIPIATSSEYFFLMRKQNVLNSNNTTDNALICVIVWYHRGDVISPRLFNDKERS